MLTPRCARLLGRAALAHYNDFGHSAIYTVKIGELVAKLSGAAYLPLLLALTRHIVRATREDKVPEFRFYESALTQWDAGGDAPLRAEDLRGPQYRGGAEARFAVRPAPRARDLRRADGGGGVRIFCISIWKSTGRRTMRSPTM